MGVSWTREQQQVIDLRKRNILVSAAAGSGKTAVLVERIIKMITEGEHPVDIDRLLVVTFTNAAAAEMRERIGAAIEKALEEHPDSEHLQRQLTLIHNAQITTIDSFCLYVIRNHFHEIDLEPDFRIGDEGELKLLKEDVLRGVLESNYEQMTPEFAAFAKGYVSGKSDAKVAEMILSLYEFSMSYPWPMEWLTSGICGYEISDVQEMAEAPWMQPLVLHLRSVLADLVKKLRIAHVLTREEDGPDIYEKVISSDLAKFEGLAACENFLELYEKLTAVTYDRLPSSRGFSGDAGKLSRVKELRDQVKDTVKRSTSSISLHRRKSCAGRCAGQSRWRRNWCVLPSHSPRRLQRKSAARIWWIFTIWSISHWRFSWMQRQSRRALRRRSSATCTRRS